MTIKEQQVIGEEEEELAAVAAKFLVRAGECPPKEGQCLPLEVLSGGHDRCTDCWVQFLLDPERRDG